MNKIALHVNKQRVVCWYFVDKLDAMSILMCCFVDGEIIPPFSPLSRTLLGQVKEGGICVGVLVTRGKGI